VYGILLLIIELIIILLHLWIDLTMTKAIPDSNCEDCQGTGLIETEGVILGRSRYSKKDGYLVIDCHGDGKFIPTQCHCVD
jgi:DnaJ-class molecular chaperone